MSPISAQVVGNEDLRVEARCKTNETARALFDSNLTLSVTVVDISTSGARISLDGGSTKFPDKVKIYIAERDMIADCKVVWRSENEIGLKFVSTAFL